MLPSSPMGTKTAVTAILLILSLFAPQLVTAGIHLHELMDHPHHHVAACGVSVESAHHHHELPELSADVAPVVRIDASAPAPTGYTKLPPVLCAGPGGANGSIAACVGLRKSDTALSLLHCAFLI